MSPQFSICRIALLAFCLGVAGCKGLPLMSGDDGKESLAPDFGLNSVPRQWEPDFEEGDTSTRADQKPASAFDINDEDDLRSVKKSPPTEKNIFQKYLKGGRSEKSGKSERKTLPKSEPTSKSELDDDFGP
ncbi:MAG: hypothetical protein NT069_11025 [Planctomycetota bacterium]|nr:hypothetical protein [Planctomycetota bacterium]